MEEAARWVIDGLKRLMGQKNFLLGFPERWSFSEVHNKSLCIDIIPILRQGSI